MSALPRLAPVFYLPPLRKSARPSRYLARGKNGSLRGCSDQPLHLLEALVRLSLLAHLVQRAAAHEVVARQQVAELVAVLLRELLVRVPGNLVEDDRLVLRLAADEEQPLQAGLEELGGRAQGEQLGELAQGRVVHAHAVERLGQHVARLGVQARQLRRPELVRRHGGLLVLVVLEEADGHVQPLAVRRLAGHVHRVEGHGGRRPSWATPASGPAPGRRPAEAGGGPSVGARAGLGASAGVGRRGPSRWPGVAAWARLGRGPPRAAASLPRPCGVFFFFLLLEEPPLPSSSWTGRVEALEALRRGRHAQASASPRRARRMSRKERIMTRSR